jgi:hypothetical protein
LKPDFSLKSTLPARSPIRLFHLLHAISPASCLIGALMACFRN